MFPPTIPARLARPFRPAPAARRSSRAVLATALALLAACAASPDVAPDAATIRDAEAALAERAATPPEAADAETLAGLAALALPRPSQEECADPRSAGFWRAAALAWNPGVRAARRELQEALAQAGVAGRPAEARVGGEVMDFGDLERETKLGLTFDLLALLRLGPAARERDAARAAVRRARGDLESAVWTAVFEVERARVRLAASRERLRRLEGLLPQTTAHAARIEILARRGRLSPADVEMVSGAEHDVEHALSSETSREAELRYELARASGLAYEHAAIALVDASALEMPRQDPPEIDAGGLLRAVPALRALLLEHAEAEADVRLAAAGAWPRLEAGPMWTFEPSDVLLGGVLDVSLPWPGRVAAAVESARARRDAARDRLEDELHAALARIASLRVAVSEARLRAEEHAPLLDEAQESDWQAVNSRLRRGTATTLEWASALRLRLGPLVGLVDERESAALAVLDLAAACGVPAAPERATPADQPGAAPGALEEVRP